MARGCPLLRKLRFRCFNSAESKLTEKLLLRLWRDLPCLEAFSLDIVPQITEVSFREIAGSCPRVTILQLSDAQLQLSLQSLAAIIPQESCVYGTGRSVL